MDLALWPACVKTHSFAEQLHAAALGGFDVLPIGPLTYRQLRDQRWLPRDIVAAAADHGVRLGHFDGFAQWSPLPFAASTPAAVRDVFSMSADECLRCCEELSLPAICATGVFDPATAPLSQLVDAFAAFCERAAALEIQVDLECIPMWGVPDLVSAWRIVEASGAGNAAVLLDSWHFFRGNADLSLLRAMPQGSIRTVQLADAAMQPRTADLLEDCLRFRKVPGEGELPLSEFIAILAEKGGITSIGPEVFADELDTMSAEAAALRVSQASRTLMRTVDMNH
ncbi:MAG: sugar phosphate isomerase/epimerase family protein [Haliea sp.]